MRIIDVMIVGQGLAGSLLAWELLDRQFNVMIVDTGRENASKVAAGLINPVTGQRLVKIGNVDQLISAAMARYQLLASNFNQCFFHSMPMLRILRSEREQKIANQRLSQIEYRNYLSPNVHTNWAVQQDFGWLQQRQTGYLNTRLLLQVLRDEFIKRNIYRQTQLDYADIILYPSLQWHDLQPRHIVFCEGHLASGNPWFGSLPFQLAKGEILTCRTTNFCPGQILNFGYWLIPLNNHQFRLGATFEPGCFDTQITEKAQSMLVTALNSFCPGLQSLEVTEQLAGIRPTTLDKQPFIGRHPKFANLHIFNGFGAKGSLLIPEYARQFASTLKQESVLSANVDINRFYATHFSG